VVEKADGSVPHLTAFARRLVSFMPGGITFVCRQSRGIDEKWNDQDIRTSIPFVQDPTSTEEWLRLLEMYLLRLLSFHKDRIPALMGIVSEMEKKRSDKFVHGVWEKDLREQLIWMQTEKHPEDTTALGEQDLPDLPSWSWAALAGVKMFLPELLPAGVVAKPKAQHGSRAFGGGCHLDQTSRIVRTTGILHRSTLARRASGELQRPSICCVEVLVAHNGSYKPEERMMAAQFGGDGSYYLPYLVTTEGMQNTEAGNQGLVIFDRDVTETGNFFILPLLLTPREEENDPM